MTYYHEYYLKMQSVLDQVKELVANYWYIFAGFCCIGILVILLFLLKLLIWTYQLASKKKFVWLVGDDKWAVVTGATDGIGYEFAVQLADKGYNLMLLSRNEEKLQRTKQRIQNKSKTNKSHNNNKEIQIDTLAVDFSELDIYDRIKQFLDVDHRDIFVLVNNVGMGNQFPDTFLNNMKMDPDIWQRMINVNIVAATKMTELILPSMATKRCGLILNVSSSTSLFPIPLLGVYSATKAYIRHFSISLAEECRSQNVYIHCLTAGWIRTNMTNNIRRIDATDPNTYVKSALNSVQNMNCFESAGFWIHRISQCLSLAVLLLISDQLFYRLVYMFMANLKNAFLYKTSSII